ncbi:MAG: decarboxylating NADP(+)-dependent phosphogluconate dehydrogenase [Candidatus Eremiobacterota bacterium]
MNIGLIGLAVMGQNLVLNMERCGYSVAVYNRTASKTEEFMKNRAAGKNIKPAFSIEELVNMLDKPRKVMIMVKAGKPVDDNIEELLKYLEKGDIIIDGGNSHFTDTDRRIGDIEKRGILYLGTGVSGGEEGALKGPCIMPGGNEKAWEEVKNIFLDISAKVDGIPCCAFTGSGSSGHFVKMVHNGIEYGDMQLIAEAYDFLRHGLSLNLEEIREIFLKWKESELNSYLIDITADILGVMDEETGKPVVDIILDKAGQKGTGKWTSQAALDLGVPVSVIDTAVMGRNISSFKSERIKASQFLKGPSEPFRGDRQKMIEAVYDSLLCSKITSYAQGMSMLSAASKEYNYNLNLHEIAQIWKGGCIIRSTLLEPIKQAFLKNPSLENLYMDEYFNRILNEKHHNWRRRVAETVMCGIPCPGAASSLEYYDSYRSERLPANLLQAQRDYFGAHTFERIDREGTFHHQWV